MKLHSFLPTNAFGKFHEKGRPKLWLRRLALHLALGAGGAVSMAALIPRIAEAAIVERIVAIVGQRAILLTDVRERALPIMARIYATIPEGPQRTAALSQVNDAILTRMVDEELEEQAAQTSGIEVTTAEVDEALARVSAQNNLSVNQILAEARRSGLTVQAYREELRRQLLQAKMGQLRLSGRIRVTEQDLHATYKRLQSEERMQQAQRTLRLRIPFGGSKREQDQQKALADMLYRRATAGEDFRQLIEEHATSAGSGLSAPLPPAQEPKNIQRTTLALEIGETSAPLRDGTDWLLLQVIERPPSTLPPFREVQEELHQQVHMEKMGAARQNWIDSLRRRTHVEVRR
jgi:peptidyl-prolyl cis-trans isomerase SurA